MPPAATDLCCDLCGLPARSPISLETPYGQRSFCCAGCKNVWQILAESGQVGDGFDPRSSAVFQQAQKLGLLGRDLTADAPAANPDPDPSTLSFAREGSALDDLRQCVLRIDGMWCASCAWLVEQTLVKKKGVVSAQVSFTSDTARVTYKPARVGEDEIRQAIAGLGYRSQLLGETDESDPKVHARRRELLRVGIGFAFAMNVMMVNFVLYAGYIDGISPAIAHFVPWLLFGLSLPVLACAWPLFDRAVRAAVRGAATMETLVCLGATTAFVYSLALTIAGSYRVYYDTADMLLGLVLVGKFIEGGVRTSATDALTLLYNLIPKKATVLKDGHEAPVAISQLAAGDQVLVRPGERIPADGFVESGTATVDESLMTGESRPVRKGIGDFVTGGTIATDAPLTVRVQRGPDAGTVAQMIGLVEEAFARKTPAERMADSISRVFVPIVIALSGATAVFLILLHAPASVVMTRAVATLVIACPCALGIATPMAMSAGVGAAARVGILIGDGGALETLTRLRTLVFDKTGTLTEGRFSVRAVFPEGAALADLGALERLSEHPIGRAVTAHVQNQGSSGVEGFERIEGAGVRGVVSGCALFAGNTRMVEAAGLTLPDNVQQQAQIHERAGLTVVYWGVSGSHVAGFVALGDTVRAGASEAIKALTQKGIACEIVSGDSEATVRAVAEELGLTRFKASATPSEKADWVAEQSEKVHVGKGTVGMVGDGVNDAPALARADLGIAMASGADIAARAAQISLLVPDLGRIPLLLTLAQRTAGVMRQNLFWAFIYNLVCIPLAMFGFINPLWAAAAMLLSSATVIANTKRLQFLLGRIAKP